MANTTNLKVQLYDESGSQIYPKTDATSVMTTNTDTNNTCLDLLLFNNNISDKVTSLAKKLTKNEELCTINGISIKYNSANTLPVGTNIGGDSGSSGVTLGSGLSDLNEKLPSKSSQGYLYCTGSGYSWESISTGNIGSTTLLALCITASNQTLSYDGTAKKDLKFGDGLKGVESTDTLTISTVEGSFKGFQYFQNSESSTLQSWGQGADGYYVIRPGAGITLEAENSTLTIKATGSTTTGSTTTDLSGYLKTTDLLSTLTTKLSTQKIWGLEAKNLFDNGGSINGNIYMKGDNSSNVTDISIYMDGTTSDNPTLVFKRYNNELIIGNGLANITNSTTCISTQTTSIKTYKSDTETYNYTFNSNNFDIGTNNLRLGASLDSEALIYWDKDNLCVRVKGSLCADGGITAFGVNSASTSTSNFTFGEIETSLIKLEGNILAGSYALYDYENSQLTLQRNGNCKLIFSTSDAGGGLIYTDTPTTSYSKSLMNLAIFAGPQGILYLGTRSTDSPQGISITDTGVITLSVGNGDNLKINNNNTIYAFNLQKAIDLGILTTSD